MAHESIIYRMQRHNTPTLRDLANYISGYSDGEGCFCVSFSFRPENFKAGWEVKPSFAVGQNFDRREVLALMKSYFECGFMRRDYGDKTLKFEVRSLNDLLDKVIPHFEEYPLKSAKQKDFLIFAKICKKMAKGDHLRAKGLSEIIKLAYLMNGCGKRKYAVTQMLGMIR